MVVVNADDVPSTGSRVHPEEAGGRDPDVTGTGDDRCLELDLSIRQIDGVDD